jgi:hypothetical protein
VTASSRAYSGSLKEARRPLGASKTTTRPPDPFVESSTVIRTPPHPRLVEKKLTLRRYRVTEPAPFHGRRVAVQYSQGLHHLQQLARRGRQRSVIKVMDLAPPRQAFPSSAVLGSRSGAASRRASHWAKLRRNLHHNVTPPRRLSTDLNHHGAGSGSFSVFAHLLTDFP